MSAETSLPGESDPQDSRGFWWLVAVLTAVFAYAFIDRTMLSLLVEPIKTDLRLTDVQLGLLIGLAFATFYSVFAIPAGYYVDRTNRTRLIGCASLVWALMTIVCGTAQSATQLFLGRMGAGMSEAILLPAAFSLIRGAAPARWRGLAFSIFAMAPIIGISTAFTGGAALLKVVQGGAFSSLPLIGGLAPWQVCMTLVGLCGTPLSLLVFALREPARRLPAEREPLLGGLWVAAQHMASRWRLYLPLLVFSAFGTMMAFGEAAWFLTALSRQWGLSPQAVGLPLGLMKLVGGIVGLVVGGVVLNRITRRGGDIRIVGVVAAILMAAGIAGALLTPDHRLGYALAFGDFVFIGLNFVIGATTLAEITPAALLGRTSAIYLLCQNLPGQALGPLTVALVSRAAGGPSALPKSLVVSQIGFALVTVISGVILGRMIAKLR